MQRHEQRGGGRRSEPGPRPPSVFARARVVGVVGDGGAGDGHAGPLAAQHQPLQRPAASFPIVGIGASAGGLEALSQFLDAVGREPGMAFVIVQHLDPSRASLLVEALQRVTPLPVAQVSDGTSIQRDHVYVIPPNTDLSVQADRLRLQPRRRGPAPHLSIDAFFRSLAAEHGRRAVGVLLSGSGADGTDGLRAIREADGITFAQDPSSARFAAMPRSAIDAGVVDVVASAPGIANELVRLARHAHLAIAGTRTSEDDLAALGEILRLVKAVGIDFHDYKRATLVRRVARRMALAHVDDLHDYVELLRRDKREVELLRDDALINVTSFFRDPEVFRALQDVALPEILANSDRSPVRVWVAGCSTGEEVYSIAVALLESLGEDRAIQIFGSDVSERVIEIARAAVYPESALRDVSEVRRQRFFTRVEHGYRVNKSLREICIFSRHDLVKDPPFSRLDLVSCRNVLIYFDQPLQRRALQMFHYALRPGGFLLLGRSETTTAQPNLYAPVDKALKLFRRLNNVADNAGAGRRASHSDDAAPTRTRTSAPASVADRAAGVDLARQVDRVLLARYTPPGVLVDGQLVIHQFRGDTSPWLSAQSGDSQASLVKMARQGILAPLRAAIAELKRSGAPVTTVANARAARSAAAAAPCRIAVVPVVGLAGNGPHYLVMFEDARSRRAAPARPRPERRMKRGAAAEDALERELLATRDYLQSLIEEHARTMEDLNAANEELVSSNEELQSMNEELETAKEELQATNEELTTVNDELRSRNDETSQINSDLVNLLATVDIPILILDAERRIRRFTPKARTLLNVLPADVGRPLDDIRANIDLSDLDRRVAEVIESNTVMESEVQDRSGRWFRLQIRPYKTTENKIEGATLSMVDIDDLKRLLGEAQQAKASAEKANRAKDDFLATLSHELRTPLATILLQAQLVGRDNIDPEKRLRAAQSIERSTRAQAQLIADLLDVSRIASGKLHLDLRPIHIDEAVRVAMDGLLAPAEARGVQITVEGQPPARLILGDPLRLQQVFANLLANAIKFSDVGSPIRVVFDPVADGTHIRVIDRGSGIDAAFLKQVFDRFAQASSSSTRTHGGLGLGLSIVKYIVEAHGGRVTAESGGPGLGATFDVFLPFLADDDDLRERRDEDGGLGRHAPLPSDGGDHGGRTALALRALRVLVVDDDPGTRDAVASILALAHCTVKTAASVQDGLAAVDDFHPGVIVCDIAMPEQDGFSFIRQLRARGPGDGGETPAMALSALANEEDRRRTLQAGFQTHVAKPVDVETLTRAVASLATLPPATHDGQAQALR